MNTVMTMKRLLALLAALVLCTAAGATIAADNSIEAINVAPMPGGKTVIKVTLKQAPANPPAGTAGVDAGAAVGCVVEAGVIVDIVRSFFSYATRFNMPRRGVAR